MSTLNLGDLRYLWRELCRQLDPHCNSAYEFQVISLAYHEARRYYHTLDHIGSCLNEFLSVRRLHLAEDELALQLAIWFHDIVYDINRTDNEEKSAHKAIDFCLRLGQRELAAKMWGMILATKHTEPHYLNHDTKLLVDIDLSIFGKHWDEFAKYEEGIRKEYRVGHPQGVPEARFAEARAKILKTLLDHGVYYTDYFRGKYEQRAGENLRRSIAELEAKIN